MKVLAIDQGTTSTRALVLESSGLATITKVIEHKQIYPQLNWVEHDPEELINNIKECIDASCLRYPDISAIGIDNQGESCLAWDAETKQALSPVIVWQDSRTQTEIDKLKEKGAETRILELSGLPLDAYFSASKLAWIIENISDAKTALKQGRLRLGTTDAFFLDRLTGNFVSDITTASRSSLMNLKTGQWDQELCDFFGVPIDTLPEIVSTISDFGVFSVDVSQGKKIPITASICDQQASLYGHGCRKAGDIKITFGTGAFAFVVTGEKPIWSAEQGLLPTVAWQFENQATNFALDGGVYNAAAAINWAKSLGLFTSFEKINQFSKDSAIERGLVFVPALSGLACPHWDRNAAGLWIGLSLDTTPTDMMQSVLEGIAFRTAEVIKTMEDFVSVKQQISIDGGLSANPYFCQFLANVLDKDIKVQNFAEITALGTAQLASRNTITPYFDSQESNVYQPNKDMTIFSSKFSRAIERSKQWF